MMGGVEGPATLLDRASMGVMAGPTALRLPPSQDMSGNAGRRGRAVLPPRAMPGHRAYDAVGYRWCRRACFRMRSSRIVFSFSAGESKGMMMRMGVACPSGWTGSVPSCVLSNFCGPFRRFF